MYRVSSAKSAPVGLVEHRLCQSCQHPVDNTGVAAIDRAMRARYFCKVRLYGPEGLYGGGTSFEDAPVSAGDFD